VFAVQRVAEGVEARDHVRPRRGHRRRGIARAMLAAMIEWGRELGREEVWVGTGTGNRAARGLYAGLGLSGEEAIIFERDL